MTLPDDLVKAVAAALRQLDAERRWSRSRAGYEVDAEAIVAALLRALPESEAVKEALIAAKLAGRHEVGEGYHFNTNEQAAVKATVAIAKLADDA